MRKILLILAALLIAMPLIMEDGTEEREILAIPPISAIPSTSVKIPEAFAKEESGVSNYPVRVIASAIHLDSRIENVGVNKKGEMAVPDGSSKRVGWYKDGTIPGEEGSAVLAAHVFAAFSNLHKLKPGDDIYIITSDNSKLHFVISERQTYLLSELSSEMLFGASGGKILKLITCAGKLTPDRSTYDQRLVISAELIEQ